VVYLLRLVSAVASFTIQPSCDGCMSVGTGGACGGGSSAAGQKRGPSRAGGGAGERAASALWAFLTISNMCVMATAVAGDGPAVRGARGGHLGPAPVDPCPQDSGAPPGRLYRRTSMGMKSARARVLRLM
jgi:hypothetical protein